MRSFKEEYFLNEETILTEIFKVPEPGFKFPKNWDTESKREKHPIPPHYDPTINEKDGYWIDTNGMKVKNPRKADIEYGQYELRGDKWTNVVYTPFAKWFPREVTGPSHRKDMDLFVFDGKLPRSRIQPEFGRKSGDAAEYGFGANTEWVRIPTIPTKANVSDEFMTDQHRFLVAGYNGSISVFIIGEDQNNDRYKYTYTLFINGVSHGLKLKWLNCKEKIDEAGINPASFRWYITKGDNIRNSESIDKARKHLNMIDTARLKISIDPTRRVDELCNSYEKFIQGKYVEMTKILSGDYKRWMEALQEYRELITEVYAAQNKRDSEITPEEKESIKIKFEEMRKKYFPISKTEPGRKLFFGTAAILNGIKKAVNSLIAFSNLDTKFIIQTSRIKDYQIPGSIFMPSYFEKFKKDYESVFKQES